MLAKIILKLIRIYQKTLSPDTGWFQIYHPHGFCRFHPHCSEYSYRAVEKYGAIKGGLKAAGRIVRCNPLSSGGYDPLK